MFRTALQQPPLKSKSLWRHLTNLFSPKFKNRMILNHLLLGSRGRLEEQNLPVITNIATERSGNRRLIYDEQHRNENVGSSAAEESVFCLRTVAISSNETLPWHKKE